MVRVVTVSHLGWKQKVRNIRSKGCGLAQICSIAMCDTVEYGQFIGLRCEGYCSIDHAIY